MQAQHQVYKYRTSVPVCVLAHHLEAFPPMTGTAGQRQLRLCSAQRAAGLLLVGRAPLLLDELKVEASAPDDTVSRPALRRASARRLPTSAGPLRRCS